jgi:hypothetical protein
MTDRNRKRKPEEKHTRKTRGKYFDLPFIDVQIIL